MEQYGIVLAKSLQDAADAVRRKTGESGTITPAGLADAIDHIPTGGIAVQPSKSAEPSNAAQTILPDTGYDALAKVELSGIPAVAETVTPTNEEQTAAANNHSVTIEAIPSEYITTTDATAIPSDIAEGKTAYVNGQKITGTNSGGGGMSLYESVGLLLDSGVGCYFDQAYAKRTYSGAVVGKHYLVATAFFASTTGQEFVSSGSYPLTGATVEKYLAKGAASGAAAGTRWFTLAIIVATATTITYCSGNAGAYIIPID